MVVLESPKAPKWSQYLCSTLRPDKSPIIHKDSTRPGSVELQHMRALIIHGAMGISMSPKPWEWLSLPDELAYIRTLSLDDQVMAHASDNRKTMFTV